MSRWVIGRSLRAGLALFVVAEVTVASDFTGYLESDVELSEPYQTLDTLALHEDGKKYPLNWDLRIDRGPNTLVPPINQHQPTDCGSCWMVSTSWMFGDNINIDRNGAFPKVLPGIQPDLQCNYKNYGCFGGFDKVIGMQVYERGLTDYSCSGYSGHGWKKQGMKCPKIHDEHGQFCQMCSARGSNAKSSITGQEECAGLPRSRYHAYMASNLVFTRSEDEMIEFLHDHGTLVCHFWSPPNIHFLSFDKMHILGMKEFGDPNKAHINHVLGVVGYGVDKKSGKKYWIGRNQWGTPWGNDGFFKFERFSNKVESFCFGVISDRKRNEELFEWVPWVKQWPKPSKEDIGYELYPAHQRVPYPDDCCGVISKRTRAKHYVRSVPINSKSKKMKTFSWHNFELKVKGQASSQIKNNNALSTIQNQFVPGHCNSGWAFSVSATMADRLTVQRFRHSDWFDSHFEARPSVQGMMASGVAGDCNGGDPYRALKAMFKGDSSKKIGDQSCSIYRGENPGTERKGKDSLCYTCFTKAGNDSCSAIKNYNWFEVGSVVAVAGVGRMKHEIYAKGPLTCVIEFPRLLWDYRTGIIGQSEDIPSGNSNNGIKGKNHAVEVVGWGKTEESEYWIVRNSFGMQWGELGFFRVQTGSNVLGIEDECYSPEVSFHDKRREAMEMRQANDQTSEAKTAALKLSKDDHVPKTVRGAHLTLGLF